MSELHENKVLFRQVVSATAQAQNIDRLFVEKGMQYLQSDLFKTEFAELYAHDQESFDHPEGWNRQPHTVSPLLTDFVSVWQNLRSVYETKIPPLAYINPIPAADKVAEVFEQIACVLRTI